MLRSSKFAVLFVVLDRLQENHRLQRGICCLNNPYGSSLRRNRLGCAEDDQKTDLLGFCGMTFKSQWEETTSQVRVFKLSKLTCTSACAACPRSRCVCACAGARRGSCARESVFCARGDIAVHVRKGGLTSLSDPKVQSPFAAPDPRRLAFPTTLRRVGVHVDPTTPMHTAATRPSPLAPLRSGSSAMENKPRKTPREREKKASQLRGQEAEKVSASRGNIHPELAQELPEEALQRHP